MIREREREFRESRGIKEKLSTQHRIQYTYKQSPSKYCGVKETEIESEKWDENTLKTNTKCPKNNSTK
jgi:hypothetical protein